MILLDLLEIKDPSFLKKMNIGHILKDKLIIIVSHDVKYIPEDAHVYEVKDKKIFCLK